MNEILFGIHSVYEALKAEKRKIFKIYTENNSLRRFEKILKQAENKNIPIEILSENKLKSITKTDKNQGIAAETDRYILTHEEDIFKNTKKGFWVILDGITDAHNLGAIIRTALCAGADGVVIPKDKAASPTPTVSKISAGALEHINLTVVNNLISFIEKAKKHGIWIAGLDANSDKSIFNADFSMPLALIIGSEEKGIRRLIKKSCDFLVSIPQIKNFNSLNASVAAGIAIYEVVRQKTLTIKN